MLKADEMVKLRIICPRISLGPVIEDLYNARVIDIIEHSKDGELDIGIPMKDSEAMSDAVVKLRSVMFQLGIEKDRDERYKELEFPKTKLKEIESLHAAVSRLTAELRETDARLKHLSDSKEKLMGVEALGISPGLLKKTGLLVFFLGFVDYESSLEQGFKKNLKTGFEMVSAVLDGRQLVCVFIDKDKENDAMNVLREHNFTELKIPEEFCRKDALKDIYKESAGHVKRKNDIDRELERTRRDKEKDIRSTEKSLSVILKKAEAPLMFAETKNISMISGWVPKKSRDRLQKKLEKTTANKIYIEDSEIGKDEGVPVKLDNPLPARPYEFLLRLFSMPSYRELDPTIFMFITFPLFFGFMLGDIGYGLVIAILLMYLMKRFPDSKDLFRIMMFSAVSSIIFGFVFGEFFGFEIAQLSYIQPLVHNFHYPFIERGAETATELIEISAVFGVVHVNFGLILGFINVLRQHGLKHAIYEKASWFILEAGAALALLKLMGFINISIFLGLGLIIVAAVMLFLGEGIQGIVELPSVFVHIGSYMRLMAIGLASVSLAIVINEQSAPLLKSGILGIVGGILIFTIGHIFNIALGVIGPFLHSLRLHYVEHFTKFYKGGGREFSPFGANED